MTTYNQRLQAVTAERGNLCVGIDPHASLLSAWDLPLTAAGVERYCRTIVDALGDTVAVFKPQSAFFEVYGSAGIAVLETVIADIRAGGATSLRAIAAELAAAGRADGEDFVAGIGYQHFVFPLSRERAVFGDHRPAVGEDAQVAFALVDHWFNGENHAGL